MSHCAGYNRLYVPSWRLAEGAPGAAGAQRVRATVRKALRGAAGTHRARATVRSVNVYPPHQTEVGDYAGGSSSCSSSVGRVSASDWTARSSSGRSLSTVARTTAIGVEIAVRQAVAHACDLAPGDAGLGDERLGGQGLYRFAYFQQPYTDSVGYQAVG